MMDQKSNPNNVMQYSQDDSDIEVIGETSKNNLQYARLKADSASSTASQDRINKDQALATVNQMNGRENTYRNRIVDPMKILYNHMLLNIPTHYQLIGIFALILALGMTLGFVLARQTYVKEMEDLQKNADSWHTQYTKMRGNADSWHTQYTKMRGNADSCEAHYNKMKENADSCEAHYNKMKENLKTEKRQCNKFKQDLKTEKRQCNKFKQDADSWHTQYTKMRENADSWHTQYTKMRGNADSCEAHYNKMKENWKTEKRQCKQSKLDADFYQEKYDYIQKNLEYIQEEYYKLKDQVAEKEKQFRDDPVFSTCLKTSSIISGVLDFVFRRRVT